MIDEVGSVAHEGHLFELPKNLHPDEGAERDYGFGQLGRRRVGLAQCTGQTLDHLDT